MKVKNIVFSGFAAAVLMGVAADANAEVNVDATKIATQAYVDRLNKDPMGTDGSYIKTVVQEDGFVTATPTAFDRTISNQSTDNNAPTSKAVYTAIQGVTDSLDSSGGPVTDGQYISGVTLTNGVVSVTTGDLATEIEDGVDKAPTTQAVFDYVAEANNLDNLTVPLVGAAGSYIQTVKQDNGVVTAAPTTFDQEIGEEDTSHTNAPTSLAVREYINTLDADTVGQDGYYIKTVAQANGKVSAEKAQFDQTITSNSTNAPTSQAVYNAIANMPNPANCQSDLCVWTSLGWVDATQPIENQQEQAAE